MQKTILSTADVARLFDITETTVKRWADEGTLKCQKTLGGHRKFDIRHVIEFATANRMEPVGTLALDQDSFTSAIQIAVLGRDFSALSNIFVEKAMSVDRHDLYEFLSYLYQHRFSLWEIYDLVVRPGLYEIGDRWKNKEIDIYREHRASHETLDAMSKLQAEIFRKPSVGKQAVCACLDDELHDIGLRCAANILEAEGWSIHYLGTRTPYKSIVESVKDVRPEIVCLSVTYAEVTSRDVGKLKDLRKLVHRAGGKLIFGGKKLPDKCIDSGYCDAMFHSMKDLAEFAYDLPVSPAQEKHRK
jgi:methanogenic corrinoid protein MtbC1